ncbi:MAG: hypothetical protein LUE11_11160 [Clostridia bacterium]|nr:hypothetical protein [Clostridia bacterium]
MIFNVIGLVIGIMVLGASVYYLAKEKDDAESKKIYSITTGVGVVIVLAVIIKILVAG